MSKSKPKINGGALQDTPDNGGQDFSLTTVFGAPTVADLPTDDFFVGEPMEIKNQDINYDSDYCAAYAGTEVSEDQEMVELVPEWTFAQAKKLVAERRGAKTEEELRAVIDEFGLNLRDICDAAVNAGFLERQYDPFRCDEETRPARAILGDWRQWPEDLAMLGAEHRKASYFTCDGPYDTFDKFRAAMLINKADHRSILTGVLWRPSWSHAAGGMIEAADYSGEAGGGHALKIFGQMKIRGELWLVAQLSNGDQVGDKGLFYFPREVVNREFTFGAYTFKDVAKDYARYHHENGLALTDSPLYKLFRVILNWLTGKK